MSPLKLICPACNAELPPKFHKKLNGFWTLLRHQPCPSCSVELQWGKHLHKKILRWGNRIKILTVIFAVTTIPLIFLSQSYPYLAFVPFILIFILVGCFIASASKLNDLYLEKFTDN